MSNDGTTPLEMEMRLYALEESFEDIRRIVASLYVDVGELIEQREKELDSSPEAADKPLTQRMVDKAVATKRESRMQEVEDRMHAIEQRMQRIRNNKRK